MTAADEIVRLRAECDDLRYELSLVAHEIVRLRAECDDLRYELSLVAHERALAESEEARREQ